MKSIFAAGARHQFETNSIIAITGDVNYSYVYSTNGLCQVHSRTIKWFMNRCPSLLRIHKSYLINIEYVSYYAIRKGKRPSGYVVLKNDMRLPISRRNLDQVRDMLDQATRPATLYNLSLGAPLKHVVLSLPQPIQIQGYLSVGQFKPEFGAEW